MPKLLFPLIHTFPSKLIVSKDDSNWLNVRSEREQREGTFRIYFLDRPGNYVRNVLPSNYIQLMLRGRETHRCILVQHNNLCRLGLCLSYCSNWYLNMVYWRRCWYHLWRSRLWAWSWDIDYFSRRSWRQGERVRRRLGRPGLSHSDVVYSLLEERPTDSLSIWFDSLLCKVDLELNFHR